MTRWSRPQAALIEEANNDEAVDKSVDVDTDADAEEENVKETSEKTEELETDDMQEESGVVLILWRTCRYLLIRIPSPSLSHAHENNAYLDIRRNK